MWRCFALLCLLSGFHGALAVDRSKFRTCGKTAFCRRQRDQSDGDKAALHQITPGSVKIAGSSLTAELALVDARYSQTAQPLQLEIDVLVNDVVRVRLNEQKPLHPRYQVQDVLLEEGLKAHGGVQAFESSSEGIVAKFGSAELRVSVAPSPFKVEYFRDGNLALTVNSDNLLKFEQYRAKAEKDSFPVDEDGMWQESFGGHTDSKPRGPASIGVDVSFGGAKHVFGIPEHASTFALKNTRGPNAPYSDPYRLFNLDVFEYELDNPMALYGAIPLLVAHDAQKTAASFWLNAAETFVDVFDDNSGKAAHWMSESGQFDLFLMAATTPDEVLFQYTALTGRAPVPQEFSIGYHQCRWNYKNEADVFGVDESFDKFDIPSDVIWLDIEHTDAKKYFTWDQAHFPKPAEMQRKLADKQRKMVTIIDPHIKRASGYHVHDQATSKGLYIKKPDGKTDFDGWCWPGSSSYLDFVRQDVRDFWANLFKYDAYTGSTPTLYTWNDMNEPSVFNGPEVTMQKDNLHDHGLVEHRDVHNLYGFYHQKATAQGHLVRSDSKDRPFVLTRSFFAGSQRYGAVWTGDNMAQWDHLEASVPMLLSHGIAGLPFIGADVGGFFGDPSEELLTRWFQVAAFQPFFRGHAHIDTKRREPWVFGEPHTSRIRKAIRSRYAILTYLYTLFHESSQTGAPVMRPIWWSFPSEEATFGAENAFLVGDALLVHPVVQQGATQVTVGFPGTSESTTWFDAITYQQYQGGSSVAVDAPIDKIPVFQRSGTIVTRRERIRRSSGLMKHDPITLVVCVDAAGRASGSLYFDDGHSFEHEAGAFVHRQFTFEDGRLSSTPFATFKRGDFQVAAKQSSASFESDVTIERIIFVGLGDKQVAKISVNGAILSFFREQPTNALVVRKPDVRIGDDWTVAFDFE